MAEKKKYNSILISGRKDETLTYSKYVKDEESGESVKETLDKKVNVSDELETQQIKNGAITNEKLAADSVGNTNLQDGSVSNEKLEDESITNEKLAENSITKDKLKDNTIGVEKLDPELRQTISAATGLPENLVETIQNVDDTLKDHQSQLNNKQSQIDDNQKQITANDEDISLLQTRSTQIEETIKSIAATGGASQATAVTYDNANSQLSAINIQSAIDELQSSKIDQTSILQESGEAEDKVMSQKVVSTKLSDLYNNISTEIPKEIGYAQKIISKDGSLVQWGVSSVTSFIEITDFVKVTGIVGVPAHFYAVAFYNESKELVSDYNNYLYNFGGGVREIGDIFVLGKEFPKAKYIRISGILTDVKIFKNAAYVLGDKKLDKSSVVQELGDSEENVASQKCVKIEFEIIKHKISSLNEKIENLDQEISLHISDTWEYGGTYTGSYSKVYENDIIKIRALNNKRGLKLITFKDESGKELSSIEAENGGGLMQDYEAKAPVKTYSISWRIVVKWSNSDTSPIPDNSIPYIKVVKKNVDNRNLIESINDSIGLSSNLKTKNKDSIVDAINELQDSKIEYNENKTDIVIIGDSIAQNISSAFLRKMKSVGQHNVKSYAIGGESCLDTIAHRNIYPYTILPPFTIPANGASAALNVISSRWLGVKIAEDAISKTYFNQYSQGTNGEEAGSYIYGTGINPWNKKYCTIGGIHGYLQFNTSGSNRNTNVKFYRDTAGEAITFTHPQTIHEDDPIDSNSIIIVFMGTNGGWIPRDTRASFEDSFAHLIEYYQGIADKYGIENCLFLGFYMTAYVLQAVDKDVIARFKYMEAEFAKRFGTHYWSCYQYLRNYGLEDCGYAATEKDIRDVVQKGLTPCSVRGGTDDGVHLTSNASEAVANGVIRKLYQLGMIDECPQIAIDKTLKILTGTVKTTSNVGVNGIKLTFTNSSDSNKVFSVTTNDDGSYSLDISSGTYNITADSGTLNTTEITIGGNFFNEANFIKS